jgi:hypothetical protein
MMIGAASVGSDYVGFEPCAETFLGLHRLGHWLECFGTGFKFRVEKCPYEDARLGPELFDIAITSPPYYDTEVYTSDTTNSANRYKSFAQWVEGFYRPLILATMARLRPGACFLLNIGDRKYPLSSEMGKIWSNYTELAQSGMSGKGGLRSSEGRETVYVLKNG